MKAIETRYKGYRFRSRLEARWAVFFDSVGLEWEYEKEGFDLGEPYGCYLPDFYLPKFNAWAEVKPEIPCPQSVEFQKLHKLTISQPAPTIGVFLGNVGQTEVVARAECLELWVYIDREIHHLAFDHTTNHGTLLCPICRYDYVHIQDSINIDGKDEYASGRGVRGDVVVIPMWCENEHSWEVDFGFHKGQTFVTVRNIKERVADFGLILVSGDEHTLRNAIVAARSARFEHGEKGFAR